MSRENKIAAIVTAAGEGKRMGLKVPKQFLKIGGETILIKTLKAFEKNRGIDYIYVVVTKGYLNYCEDLIAQNGLSKVISVVKGGERRQDSVFKALQEINRTRPGTEYVLVHDGVRPFVKGDVIDAVIRESISKGAAVACVAMKDSIRKTVETDDASRERRGSKSVDRSKYYSVQTPQGFRKSILIDAYSKAYDDSFYGTDDAQVVERAGYEIGLVDGDYSNVKITTREDLPMDYRVGSGFDAHRLAEGRDLILGGVRIPHEKGLAGHSDADVVIHAVIDALLGAAGLGDIGSHFPDTDKTYKGISSIELIKNVRAMIDDYYFEIGNIDVTVIAEQPRIGRYADDMRQKMAEALGIEKSRINLKATTTENMGFTGRGEGIAAEAVCMLYR